MESLKLLTFTYFIFVASLISASEKESSFSTRGNVSKQRFSFKRVHDGEGFSSLVTTSSEKNVPFKNPESLNHLAKKNVSSNKHTFSIKRFDNEDLDGFSYKSAINLDNYWVKTPYHNFTSRKDSIKKHDYSSTWPTWSSKKEIYHNNRNKKNRKYIDSIEDYLGLDSKYHDMADRKYIHEHEGFFFPIHVPSSHHEKDDHLIPLLLLLLLPLLLFAIIIPLNANLLSTLFLIMQNNGATTTAAQLAAASGRRKRHLYQPHPIVEEKIMEILHRISSIPDF